MICPAGKWNQRANFSTQKRSFSPDPKTFDLSTNQKTVEIYQKAWLYGRYIRLDKIYVPSTKL